MRVSIAVTGVLVSVALIAPFAAAQNAAPMSSADLAAACAPPSSLTNAAHALRVLGAQDTIPRAVYGPSDLLIVNGGTGAGVQLGAEFFLRRRTGTGAVYGVPPEADLVTDGWIKIVAVNESTSIGQVEHACGGIFAADYLEPFVAPQAVTASNDPIEPDFSSLGRVISGADDHTLTGINQLAIVDRGSDEGLQPGSRFAVYRDLTSGVDPMLAAPSGTPLAAVGEGVVLSSTGNRAVVRIVRARDAIQVGDYIAAAKP